MFHVVLYEPEIPPNTGNIIRLCANTGSQLHLIHPLGFTLDDPKLRRAGLDYLDLACVHEHDSLDTFMETQQISRVWAISTRGMRNYSDVQFQDSDVLLFGPETRGLPEHLLASLPAEQVLRIPMVPEIRSLNLSNAVAVVLYEAWRQCDFC
ncbi:MAG: tRNA (uridine(34)/cytosine(34)/5-carboxymethylaminomethyluridine(34)-2'-O)-methyltransferase TrmL [Gammaproteobacteria bacterium]